MYSITYSLFIINKKCAVYMKEMLDGVLIKNKVLVNAFEDTQVNRRGEQWDMYL